MNNHLNPNPALANAGRLQAAMNQQAMIRAIEEEAERMGVNITDPDSEPTMPIPDAAAA